MNDLLARALTAPQCLESVGLRDWDYFIPKARQAGVLGRIDALLAEHELLDKIPQPPRFHLQSARVIAENEKRVMLWELNRIARALGELDAPIVLLKGAAYVMCDLPNARGRISSDVDILVPRMVIDRVEKALFDHGWLHIKLDDYDQYFYRHWSHELPPLRHKDRGTIVDVHHTILPPTGRLHPDPEKLLAASLPVEGTRFRVLAPADMLLHSAAHAFQDGDLTRGLRDLVDIDELLRHFSGKDPGFWERLSDRAAEMDLTRPLYYALRYSHRFLETPIPERILQRVQSWRPAWPASVVMDTIAEQMITAEPWRRGLAFKASRQLLYMRSHWLRMPPYLLVPHLIRKALLKRSAGGIERRAGRPIA
jgi:hypothetical protein